MLFGVLALFAIGALSWRARHLHAMQALSVRRRRLGPDGVVIGGEGFTLSRVGAPAVLLLHGAGDTPQTLRYLATALHDRGFHVSAPLLPGHGRSLRDFMSVTANDLAAAARATYEELKKSHDWVGVIGISMGGGLAVPLAADNPALPALALVAPYLAMPPRLERFARFAGVWGFLIPAFRSGDAISVLDPVERERNLAYGVFTASALRALFDITRLAIAALPRVAAPTLVIQSRADNRIAVADAERAFALLGSRDKHLEWMTAGAHIITVDYGREVVIARLAAFMEEHVPPRASTDRGEILSP